MRDALKAAIQATDVAQIQMILAGEVLYTTMDSYVINCLCAWGQAENFLASIAGIEYLTRLGRHTPQQALMMKQTA